MIKTQECYNCKEIKLIEDFHLSRHKTPERKCKSCKHEDQRNRRKSQSVEQSRMHRRFLRMKQVYSLDKDSFLKMFKKQNESCAICDEQFDLMERKSFSVDHDHSCCPGKKSCGKCVRGLLCVKCNFVLGYVNDDTNKLKNMIKYLQETKI